MPWGAGALCLFQAEWAGSNCCLGWGCAAAIPSRAEEKSKIEIKQSNFQSFQGGVMRRKIATAQRQFPFKFGCRSVGVNWPISGSDPINLMANAWSLRQPPTAPYIQPLKSCDRTAKLNGLIKRNGHHLNASGALA